MRADLHYGHVNTCERTNTRRTGRISPNFRIFSNGIARRDQYAMKRVVLPEGGATIIRHNQILHFTLKTVCERPFPPGTVSLEEKIYDPLVRIDDNIAMVWARYEFLIDGKLDHWGTDIINLVFVDGKWVIAGVLDNSRRSDEPVKPLTFGS